MARKGKRYRDAASKVAARPYSLVEGMELLKTLESAKFDETVELSMRLGVDPRRADQMVRGTVLLPHGTGRTKRVLVIADGEFASAHGLESMGTLVSWGVAGVPPRIMGIGPAPAARKALAEAGLSLDDMDLVEVNEAFAPQYVAVERELGLDRERVNVNGGAIALTHPLGATGARITSHLLHELRRRGGGLGLGSACIGGGQGIAVIVKVDG